jgi:hypothetical protein
MASNALRRVDPISLNQLSKPLLNQAFHHAATNAFSLSGLIREIRAIRGQFALNESALGIKFMPPKMSCQKALFWHAGCSQRHQGSLCFGFGKNADRRTRSLPAASVRTRLVAAATFLRPTLANLPIPITVIQRRAAATPAAAMTAVRVIPAHPTRAAGMVVADTAAVAADTDPWNKKRNISCASRIGP